MGYGDVNPTNSKERTFQIFVSLVGVVSFSFIAGALSSLMTSFDDIMQEKDKNQERLLLLNEEYKFGEKLTLRLEKNLDIQPMKDPIEKSGESWLLSSMSSFDRERRELAKRIHWVNGYHKITFFNEINPFPRRMEFIAWISDLFEEVNLDDATVSWMKKGQKMKRLIFVKEGKVPYILDDVGATYHTWKTGDVFGFEDYIYRMNEDERHDLADDEINFCHFKVKNWGKRYFTPVSSPDT